MDAIPLAVAKEPHAQDVLALDAHGARAGSVRLAAASQALSDQVNEIGMTGFGGGAHRLEIVAREGLMATPQGMLETVKKEGVVGLASTAVESAAVGFGLRLMLSKAAPVAEIATLALGTSFVAKTVPQFWDACARGLNAHTWGEMHQASSAFGQATGSLAVDSIVGFAGYKLGAGAAGHTTWANRESLARAIAPTAAEAAAKPADAAAEIGQATDEVKLVKSVVSPEHTVSMRDLAERDPEQFKRTLDQYYPKLQNAFPDASEIESKETYNDYLHDKDFPWDMLVLHDKAGNVLGGIQSQEVAVGGTEIQKAIWAEHIWLAPEARTYTNFQTLLKTAGQRWSATGSDVVFMEFNDRAKMTWQQQVDDASAGLSPEARERIWGRVGLYVLGDEAGRIAPYAQPAMGDGAPVEYLSIGMAPLKGKLDGKSIPIDDYLKLLKAAHSTIPDVDLDTDPTVLQYTAGLNAIKATGQDRLSFAKLKDTEVLRLINERFIITKKAGS